MPNVLPIFADEVSEEDAFYVLEVCFFLHNFDGIR